MAVKVPKNQMICETYIVNGKPQYVITRDLQKTKYILNKVDEDGKLTKLKTSKYPLFKEVGK